MRWDPPSRLDHVLGQLLEYDWPCSWQVLTDVPILAVRRIWPARYTRP